MLTNYRVYSKKYYLLNIFNYIHTTIFSNIELWRVVGEGWDRHPSCAPSSKSIVLTVREKFLASSACPCLSDGDSISQPFCLQNCHGPSLVLLAVRAFGRPLCHPEVNTNTNVRTATAFDSSPTIGIICIVLGGNFRVTHYGPNGSILLPSLHSHMRKKFVLVKFGKSMPGLGDYSLGNNTA